MYLAWHNREKPIALERYRDKCREGDLGDFSNLEIGVPEEKLAQSLGLPVEKAREMISERIAKWRSTQSERKFCM